MGVKISHKINLDMKKGNGNDNPKGLGSKKKRGQGGRAAQGRSPRQVSGCWGAEEPVNKNRAVSQKRGTETKGLQN